MIGLDLSLCMIVKDEEDVLKDCLNSVKDIVSEMIIVDTGSTDDTKEIAREMGAHVVEYSWNGDFAKARNTGLEKATKKWILVLDADEIWDKTNDEQLTNLLKEETIYAYYVKMFNYYGASSDQDYVVDSVCRLFRNLPGIRFNGMIHEEVTNSIKYSFSEKYIAFSNLKIHHYGYLDEVIDKKKKNERNFEAVQRALIENPEDLYLQYALGTEYFQRGNLGDALQVYESIISKTPVAAGHFSDLLFKTVSCLKELHEYPKALQYIEKGKVFFPDFPDLLEINAQILLELDEYKKAEQTLIECKNCGDISIKYSTSSSAGTSQTEYLLGVTKERQFRWELAKDHFAVSFLYNRHFFDSLASWTKLELFFVKDTAGFFKQLRNRFGHMTFNEYLVILMQAVRRGRSDIGMPLIEKLNAVKPGSTQVQTCKAIFLAQMGDYERAKIELKKLVDQPSEQNLLYLWAVCHAADEMDHANLYLYNLTVLNPLYTSLYEAVIKANTGVNISSAVHDKAKETSLTVQNRGLFIELLNNQIGNLTATTKKPLPLVPSDLFPFFYFFSKRDLHLLISNTYKNLSCYDYSSLILLSWAALKIQEWEVAYTALKIARNLKPKRLEHTIGYSLFLNRRLLKKEGIKLELDSILLGY